MLGNNPISKIDLFKCKKKVMEYFVYQAGIPMIAYDNDYYYFKKTEAFKEAFKKMPAFLKILSSLRR
jgi:hypothetical protein